MRWKGCLILIGSLLVVCLLVIVTGSGAYYLLRLGRGQMSRPVVDIRSPRYGEQVSLNKATLVRAIARDPEGVIRVELWVDGELVSVETSEAEKSGTPLLLLEDWQPASLGQHTLVVRAYDRDLRTGQASVIVEAADLPAPEAVVVQRAEEGEALEGAVSLTPEEMQAIAEHSPQLAEALEAGEVALIPAPPDPPEESEPPLPEPPEPLEGEGPPEFIPTFELSPWIWRMAGVVLETFELPGAWLEVEGLSLEVDKEYDGVYCYVSLGGLDMERVPAEGFLPTPGGRYWDIEASMGGENRRMVPIPEGRTPLVVDIQCLGFMESESGGVVSDLGTLLTSHPEEEWDGRRLERWVSGQDGWFQVAYRITEAGVGGGEEEEPFPSPKGLSKRCFENPFLNVIFCVLSWNYPEEHLGEIDGYFVVRNGEFYLDLPLGLPAADLREVPLFEGDGVPSCGDRYEYQVMAYQGELYRSAPSNTVVLEGEACLSRTVKVTFETLQTLCLTGDCLPHVGPFLPPLIWWPYTELVTYCPSGCEGGCHYATLWVNEHELWFGESNDFVLCYDWRGGGIYPVAEMAIFGEGNPVQADLSPYESLEIEMRLYDSDSPPNRDDLQCGGGYTFSPNDLRAIASTPERRQTFTRRFGGGGGVCELVFTIEVLPQIELPEHPGELWPPEE